MESSTNNFSWMPQSNRLYYTRKGLQGKELVTVDPVTKAETTSPRICPMAGSASPRQKIS